MIAEQRREETKGRGEEKIRKRGREKTVLYIVEIEQEDI